MTIIDVESRLTFINEKTLEIEERIKQLQHEKEKLMMEEQELEKSLSKSI